MASGCAICAATNQCSFAFHNGPGQYCGQWYDYETLMKKPCCCPLLQVGMPSTCAMTPTQCKCHIYDTQTPPPPVPVPAAPHAYIPQHNHETREAPFIMLLLVICCCFMMCCCRKSPENNHHHHTHDGVPIARAVDVDASCPPENPVYATKTYGSTSTHHHHHHQDSGGGGGGSSSNAVASGLGGFAIGAIVGDLIGRNSGGYNRGGTSHHNNVAMFRSNGNDGGYDIIGDSGDNVNYGYNILQGDSGGGGGYDIQGDS
jgi:hypothetical protein